MKIEIILPAAYVKKLKCMLDRLEIPHSEIQRWMQQDCVTDQNATDEDLWLNHVYPDRQTALRVAKRLVRYMKSDHVGLNYREGGKLLCEFFLSRDAAQCIFTKGKELTIESAAEEGGTLENEIHCWKPVRISVAA